MAAEGSELLRQLSQLSLQEDVLELPVPPEPEASEEPVPQQQQQQQEQPTPAQPDQAELAAPPRPPVVGLAYDERMMLHEDPNVEHPEQPARISYIYEELQKLGLAQLCQRVPCREATPEELAGVHSQQYVQEMAQFAASSPSAEQLDAKAGRFNSIFLNQHSQHSGLISAGSVVECVKRVAEGSLDSAVAVVRPPGHHAEAHTAMGFCLYNNVAAAAKAAVESFGLERVLIVDWDVHHGNGTQRMFESDSRVMYFSVHLYLNGRFYPHSTDAAPTQIGRGAGEGTTVNVAWNRRGMGDADYIACWQQVLLPIAYEWNPQLVIISAGFDACAGDPIGMCEMTAAGYAHLTHMLRGLANGKVVLALEGGYDLVSISEAFAACTRVLLGGVPPALSQPCVPSAGGLEAIAATVASHKKFWYSLGRLELENRRATRAQTRTSPKRQE